MKILIDSNVLIGYYNEEDDLHEKAVRFFEENDENIKIISFDVVDEIFTYICYKFGVDEALKVLEDIIDTKDFEILDYDIEELFYIRSLAFKYQVKMSFTDYTLLYLMTKEKIKLFTFDRQLNTLVN